VDSTTAGIFDLSHFRDDSVVTPEIPIPQLWMKYLKQKSNWEGMCHTAAYGELSPRTWTFVPGSVVPFGVVSVSGCGDGGYSAYVKRNSKGEAVAVKIVFIGEDEE
jgi:hypothetical protein